MTSPWTITNDEKNTISSLVAKGKAEQQRNSAFSIIDLESFYKLFDKNEIAIIQKFLTLDPILIDYKVPFIGVPITLPNLVPISNQTILIEDKSHTIPTQYLPKETFDAYEKLNDAMGHDIGKRLLVLYGYRSPARQAFIFFDILKNAYDFDVAKTLRRVCLPDYSEHVCFQKQAIDFTTSVQKADQDFATTPEYAWLKTHAAVFNFFESYPKDNALNMMYEPWHWRHDVSSIVK